MSNTRKLSDLITYGGLRIFSGQILSRIKANSVDDCKKGSIEFCRVINPKVITTEGVINETLIDKEEPFVVSSKDKLTKEGDIIIKLSTPFDSATITNSTKNCIVPSFCATIRNNSIDSLVTTDYLQAFLNSSICKKQLENMVLGIPMTIISIGMIKDIVIPIPNKRHQEQIGQAYRKMQEKHKILKQIFELENKKNEIIFKELMQ